MSWSDIAGTDSWAAVIALFSPPPVVASTVVQIDAVLPTPSSLSRLVETKIAGPPPPRWVLTLDAVRLQSYSNQFNELKESMPRESRTWMDLTDQCLQTQQTNNGTNDPWINEQRCFLYRAPRLAWDAGIRPVPTTPRQWTGLQVKLLFDNHPEWKSATVHHYKCALRHLLRSVDNPAAEVRGLWRRAHGDEERPKLPTGFAEVERLFRVANGRQKVLIVLLGLLGLRPVTAGRMVVANVTDGWLLLVRSGKYGHSGRLPLVGPAREVLERWIAGKPATEPLYPWKIAVMRRDVRALRKATGIAWTELYAFRRTAATAVKRKALELGISDTKEVQRLFLTHGVPQDVTDIYDDPDYEPLRRTLEALYGDLEA